MRKRILYVGHAFHLKTRSTRFLLEILETAFEVTSVAVDPDNIAGLDVSKVNCDIVVILQMDFLAPIFLARGLPTVVIPMYDGSANMPESHWRISSQARFIAFARQLHVQIQRGGAQSLLVRYFPEPSPRPVSFRQGLRGFFWERRPDSINCDLISRLVGDELQSLHVHRVPDVGSPGPVPTSEMFGGKTSITTSTWFENKEEFDRTLAQSNVYFAPRLSEGIGMGFLEALANGMLVFASDFPTHNEYITNWDTGVLFDHQSCGRPDLSPAIAAEIGANAHQAVADGRRRWLNQVPELLEWIATTPAPKVSNVEAQFLATELPAAYAAGFGAYVNYLKRNAGLVRNLAAPSHTEARKSSLAHLPDDDQISLVPPLVGRSIYFGSPSVRPYLISGWSHDEPGFVWMDGTSALVRFALSPELEDATVISIQCHAPATLAGQRMAIVVNGTLVGSIDVSSDSKAYTFALPEGGLLRFNDIRLYAEQFEPPAADPRKLSVAVTSLMFE